MDISVVLTVVVLALLHTAWVCSHGRNINELWSRNADRHLAQDRLEKRIKALEYETGLRRKAFKKGN